MSLQQNNSLETVDPLIEGEGEELWHEAVEGDNS